MNFTQQRGIYLPIEVRTLLYANLITKATTNQHNYNKVMSYLERYESQRRHNLQTTTTKTTSFQSQRSEPREVKMEMEGSSYRSHDMQAFSRQDHASMTESRQWYSGTNRGIYYSSFKQPSLESKMIGGDRAMTEDWRVMGHPTMSADRDEESSVVVVQREKPAFVTPEWMEERPSPKTRRRNPEVSDISNLLKYLNSYVPKMVSPDPVKVQYESTIRPEVAKRDNSVPVLQDFEVDDEDDEDEEYDEFEEVIVIVDVQRKPVWHRGLELPKAETQKVGVPIQDLLQLPTRRVKRESAQAKLSVDSNSNDITIIDEKIEFVQRPVVVQVAQNLASIFQGF